MSKGIVATSDKTKPWDKLGIQATGIDALPHILNLALKTESKVPICFVGESGIGKTEMVKNWAESMGGAAVTLSLAHMSPEDIGIPLLEENGMTFGFARPRFLDTIARLAKELDFVVLFLDEWNRGEVQLVNAVFTLTDTRHLHDFVLPDNVLVVCAMNPSDGAYSVNKAERDHAIRRRVNFVYVKSNTSAWLKYAKSTHHHDDVVTFIETDRTSLYDPVMRDQGKCFPCPANWTKVSDILTTADQMDIPDHIVETLVEGQIGYSMSTKFMAYRRDKNTAIHPTEILDKYTVQGQARTKVAALLGKKIKKDGSFIDDADKPTSTSNTSALVNISEALALYLLEEKPNLTDKRAKHLSQFLADIPPSQIYCFTYQHLEEAKAKQSDPVAGQVFVQELSQALSKQPVYAEVCKSLQEEMRKQKAKD